MSYSPNQTNLAPSTSSPPLNYNATAHPSRFKEYAPADDTENKNFDISASTSSSISATAHNLKKKTTTAGSATNSFFSPFNPSNAPPIFETVDIDNPFNLTNSAKSTVMMRNATDNNKTSPAQSQNTAASSSSYFVHRVVLGEETAKIFEDAKRTNNVTLSSSSSSTTTTATSHQAAAANRPIHLQVEDDDSDSDSNDDDDEDIPPPPKEPYPVGNINLTNKKPAENRVSTSSSSSVSAATGSPPQQQQAASNRFVQSDVASPSETATFAAQQNQQHQSNPTNLAHNMNVEEMMKNDDRKKQHTFDDSADDDEGFSYEEDYSILQQHIARGIQSKKSKNGDSKYAKASSSSASSAQQKEQQEQHETQPDFRDVECMFHQLRLEQRVAGELAGVLREQQHHHPHPHLSHNTNLHFSSAQHSAQSSSVRSALDKQRDLKRQRDALLHRETLQSAREQETTYQLEEVSNQTARRLDGLTDVLQRSIDSEATHFSAMRDLEDRIIDKQRAAQLKKLELQRLQEIAEDCISQLTTFELRNTSRERMIVTLEKELEARQKEWSVVQGQLDKRLEAVQGREKKIAEWVEALETKEKHLTNQDLELKGFADEFLRREEAVRVAKNEHVTVGGGGVGVGHQYQQQQRQVPPPPPPPPPPANQHFQQQHGPASFGQANLVRPTTATTSASATSTRFVPSSAAASQPLKSQTQTQQQQQHTPEQLDRDDDDGVTSGGGHHHYPYSPGVRV